MNWFFSDIGKFAGLYIGCIITTYFLPNVVSQLFFLLLLFLFYRSKNNYFWFAFIFFLVDPPGGLFPMDDYNYGLPMYNFLPGSGRLVYFQELFIFTALIKALRTGYKPKIIFIKPLIILGVYLIFLFFISFFIGISPLKVFSTIRNILPWSLVYSISVLISNHKDWLKFFRIIFVLLIVSFSTQILFIYLNQPPAYLLGTDFSPVMIYENIDYTNISSADPSELRPISSSAVSLIALMGAMFYILYREKSFARNYLFIILFLAYFSILVTATRGWVIAFSIMLLIFMVIERGSLKSYIRFILLLIVGIYLILSFPMVKSQLKNSLSRMGTMEKIYEGDLTAGGTLSRIDEYSPKVMAKFYESPVFGWGFSDTYYKFSNGHVGNQSLLLNVGVIGYLLFAYFWLTICLLPIIIRRRLQLDNPLRNSLFVMPTVFIGFFILHSTSGQMFLYAISYFAGGFGQIFFYCFANFYILNAIDLDLKSNPKQLNLITFKTESSK